MLGRGRSGAERGIALVLVLWGLVAIGLVITHITAAGRHEARIARNAVTAAEAEAAADGGIFAAVFHLAAKDQTLQWDIDGRRHDVQVGDALVEVTMWDDDGRINPNLAPDILLSALFRVLAMPADQAAALATAISAWHDPVLKVHRDGGGEDDYRAAGRTYGPPGSPIQDIDELNRVLGMTPELLEAARPHLSICTNREVPIAEAADPVVLRALDLARQSAGGAIPLLSETQRSLVRTVVIRSRALLPSGGQFSRQAILRMGPMLRKGYQLLAWDRVTD
ncbi:type II secretion system protein GspK [Telmatospirillum sp.]|uniref:general secretion pathway protein GspK n=1 Tax=Telmatospirillum sp. TaxID=2079197 RepID=UPI00283AEE08|nr:type II secretion system protein GspK [Telmatospirillum sp.]MDR3439563.1 type II secretion system protein GspK [Telmatospirillum sp.]